MHLGRGKWEDFVQGPLNSLPLLLLLLFLTFSFAQLPGHKGTVTSVDFHPKEPISMHISRLHLTAGADISLVLTGSKDGTMLLGEIEAGLA